MYWTDENIYKGEWAKGIQNSKRSIFSISVILNNTFFQ